MSAYDVIIVGAGPAGCVAALEQARLGRRILLLEAASGKSTKLAGEWIHPPGMAILNRLGVDFSHVPHGKGRGFVVFPDDSSEPVVLGYAGPAEAVSCDHELLVDVLRSKVTQHPEIDLLLGARVVEVAERAEGAQVMFLCAAGEQVHVSADLIVGADGRSSVVRRATGVASSRTRLSRMAGLLLRDVELPYENFGHVLLGVPGPVLIYRLGPGEVRVCLDVPGTVVPDLLEAYSTVFPSSLRPSFHAALATEKVRWASNFSAPRVVYGSGRLALVGDATGVTHPLTAAGLTQSFTDGACLARSGSVGNYARSRRASTRVPDMLAFALYDIFTGTREGDREIRRAIYYVWRTSSAQRSKTMRLLSTQDTGRRHFLAAFLNVMARAGFCLFPESAKSRGWRYSFAAGISFAMWLLWLARHAALR